MYNTRTNVFYAQRVATTVDWLHMICICVCMCVHLLDFMWALNESNVFILQERNRLENYKLSRTAHQHTHAHIFTNVMIVLGAISIWTILSRHHRRAIWQLRFFSSSSSFVRLNKCWLYFCDVRHGIFAAFQKRFHAQFDC